MRKSLVEQEHATESSLYCKQLVSICVIFYNSRFQSWEILTTEQSQLWLDMFHVICIICNLLLLLKEFILFHNNCIWDWIVCSVEFHDNWSLSIPLKYFCLNIVRNRILQIQWILQLNLFQLLVFEYWEKSIDSILSSSLIQKEITCIPFCRSDTTRCVLKFTHTWYVCFTWCLI